MLLQRAQRTKLKDQILIGGAFIDGQKSDNFVMIKFLQYVNFVLLQLLHCLRTLLQLDLVDLLDADNPTGFAMAGRVDLVMILSFAGLHAL